MPRNRNIIVLVYDDGQIARPQRMDGMSAEMKLREAGAASISIQNQFSGLKLSDKLNEYHCLDLKGHELSPDDTLDLLPHPGVLLFCRRVSDDTPMAVVAHGIRAFLRDKNIELKAEDDEEFLIYIHDVFFSYAEEDKELAQELSQSLTDVGAKVFLAAKSLNLGDDFVKGIRDAMALSRAGIILLTPHSVDSKWVIAEAGALWALEKTIIPVTLNVDINSLPDIIRKNQSLDISTMANRQRLVSTIKGLAGL